MKKKRHISVTMMLIFIGISVHITFAGHYLSIENIDSKSKFPKISVTVSLKKSSGNELSGIDAKSIEVYEDGHRVDNYQIEKSAVVKEHLTMFFLFSLGKRTTRSDFKQILSLAKELVLDSGKDDTIAVIGCNDLKSVSTFIINKQDIIQCINKIRKKSDDGPLFQSSYDALAHFNQIKDGKKSVIVFTDGRDSDSSVNDDDIIRYARDKGIQVIFVHTRNVYSVERLKKISGLTGGDTICINSISSNLYARINPLFSNFAYVIQYQSKLAPDSGHHLVEVKLNRDSIQDSDSATIELSAPNRFPFISIQWIIIILLALILLVLLLLLLFTIIIWKKNGRKTTYVNDTDHREQMTKKAKTSSSEEEVMPPETDTVSSYDTEYKYAYAWLIEKEGHERGKKFPVHWTECTIGKGNNSNIKVGGESISEHHAKIKQVDDSFYLYDTISDSGTYLNGKKLLRPRLLNDWDEIMIGGTVFIFRGAKKPIYEAKDKK